MKEKGDKMGNGISFDEVYKDVEERISKTISELEKKYGFRNIEERRSLILSCDKKEATPKNRLSTKQI